MGMIPFAAFDPDLLGPPHDGRSPLAALAAAPPRRPTRRGAILDEAFPPFRMTVRQTLDVTALGYDYAVASSSSLAETRR